MFCQHQFVASWHALIYDIHIAALASRVKGETSGKYEDALVTIIEGR